jgi:hypothetical protein
MDPLAGRIIESEKWPQPIRPRSAAIASRAPYPPDLSAATAKDLPKKRSTG